MKKILGIKEFSIAFFERPNKLDFSYAV